MVIFKKHFSESPFILEGTIDKHLSNYTEKYLAEVAKIRDDPYVDDLITCGENVEQVTSLKDMAIKIFCEAGFKLHKWHSNVPALEGKESANKTGQTFAKQQLDVKLNQAKMLDISWKKNKRSASCRNTIRNKKKTY